MKCPMSNYVMERESGEDEVLLNDCFKEKCAWWDDATKVCVISRIGLSLNVLVAVLSVIKDKMPTRKE